ncbi:MAG TPA: acyl carrier protein [Kofleriaceae bacterium]|nr:acyl carrier protein [Kofleriaceae bacterium]
MTDEREELERIAGQLRAHITRVAGLAAPPRDDDRLADHGYQASLALLELVDFLEDTFRIKVRPVDLAPGKLGTIAQIAAMVRARITASR